MNSKVEKLLKDDLDVLTGFAYAVPLQWYLSSKIQVEIIQRNEQ